MADCCSGIDVRGLHALATLSANLKAGILEKLKNGALGILTVVWKEFEDLYEDEAEALAEYVSKKISLGKKSRLARRASPISAIRAFRKASTIETAISTPQRRRSPKATTL